MSLYEAFESAPTSGTDPLGLQLVKNRVYNADGQTLREIWEDITKNHGYTIPYDEFVRQVQNAHPGIDVGAKHQGVIGWSKETQRRADQAQDGTAATKPTTATASTTKVKPPTTTSQEAEKTPEPPKRDLGVGKSKTQQELMERYLELVKQNPVFKNDPAAGLAIIWVESHGDPAAYRHEPGFYRRYIEGKKQWEKDPAYSDSKRIAASYGAMQVMYTTAVGLGYQGAPEDLYGNKGLEYGSKYYEQQLKKYGDVIDAYAAYNAGSVRKTKEGKYENQANVDKFVEAYKEFKAVTDKK